MTNIIIYLIYTDEGKVRVLIRCRETKTLMQVNVPKEFDTDAVVSIGAASDGEFEYQVKIDYQGLYTIPFDATPVTEDKRGLLIGYFDMFIQSIAGTQTNDILTIYTLQGSLDNPFNAVPVDWVTTEWFSSTEGFPIPTKLQPGVCSCTSCSENDNLKARSTDVYGNSYTPTEHGVELTTVKKETDLFTYNQKINLPPFSQIRRLNSKNFQKRKV